MNNTEKDHTETSAKGDAADAATQGANTEAEQPTQSTQAAITALDQVADELHLRSDEEIEHLINETEEALQALMQELKKRQQSGQHKSIDYLEAHLENADTSFKALRNFIAMALKEIRGGS